MAQNDWFRPIGYGALAVALLLAAYFALLTLVSGWDFALDASGREYAPLAWQGDPPGGHHRKGVLRFKPLAAATLVELRISGVGGVATRRFRWELR